MWETILFLFWWLLLLKYMLRAYVFLDFLFTKLWCSSFVNNWTELLQSWTGRKEWILPLVQLRVWRDSISKSIHQSFTGTSNQTTFYYAWTLSQRFLILGLLKLPQLGAQDLDRWEHLDIWHQRLLFVNPYQSGQIFTVLGLCSWSSLLDVKPSIVRDKTKNSI